MRKNKPISMYTKEITETITRTRYCCKYSEGDLLLIRRGELRNLDNIYQCKHCGQFWTWKKHLDASGNWDEDLVRCHSPFKTGSK